MSGLGSQVGVGGAGCGAGSRLVKRDDMQAVVNQARRGPAQMNAGQSMPAVQTERHVLARPEVMSHNGAACDLVSC